MTYCGEASLVKTVGQNKTIVSLRCRSWCCEECKVLRKRQLTAEAIGGSPATFITLTSRRDGTATPDQAAAKLAHAWRLTRLRLMRLRKWKKCPFIAVFQATKLGWPHLHILARCGWIDRHWLSAQMAELIDSPIVDVRHIDNVGRVGAYVSRYVSRETERFGTSKRYWQTRDYDLRPEPPEKQRAQPGQGWERFDISAHRVVTGWLELGWVVRWTSHRTAEATIPP